MRLSEKIFPSLVVLTLAAFVASGCNTFKGAGRDIQKGGKAIENAAEEVEDGK
jgi:entericidin B